MTDETRPGEGRTTSDFPEPQGRPEFLPAEETGEHADRRSDPPASFGASWGDPSGRAEQPGHSEPGAPPYQPQGPSEPSGPSPYEPVSASPSPYEPVGRSEGAPPSPYEGGGPSGAQGGARAYEGPSFESPGASRGSEGPFFETPGGTRAYEGPFFESPGGTRAYESPSFGPAETGPRPPQPPPFMGAYGGHQPPPPRQAMGMGPGWAPPPPGAPGAGTLPRRGLNTGALIAIAVAIALVASVLGSLGTYLLTRTGSSGTDPSYSLGPVPTGATNRAPDSVAGVAARVLPSVVSLEVGNGANTEGASGSGFLIKNGYVVTNNHVVAMAAKGGEIRIMFNNRKTTAARIVGRDPGSDLAVVKPEETFGTPEITLGNSDQVVVGDPVIAIGSPLGLTGTVTTGIVSSLNRPVIAGDETGAATEEPAYISAIQTDAAINPGNSGGPLVNGRGEVVGVNSAIATLSRSVGSQSGSIGLGFAIPVNQTRRVAEELITTGKAKRPKIGIVLDKDYKGQGVRIASEPAEGRQPVDANGPADKAGLKAGDVIIEVDGLTLQDGNELIALIRSKAPGAKLTVKYQRAGQERTATLTIVADEQPAPTPS
ncbi:trypsin-like peptidase domain-containing protein [Nonomuraea spiralis]|uniref:trypsin-like peptidase domain-containing protein n=1 Tax=Nonomuraea spiralis TaxID=46182 RepID=UPI0037BB3309